MASMTSKGCSLEKSNSQYLDDFGGLKAVVAELGSVFREWRACDSQLKDLERAEQERLRLLDLWKFQRNEIESAQLLDGEDAELEAERRVLQNVGRISEGAGISVLRSLR